jgi:hypothetical protein
MRAKHSTIQDGRVERRESERDNFVRRQGVGRRMGIRKCTDDRWWGCRILGAVTGVPISCRPSGKRVVVGGHVEE